MPGKKARPAARSSRGGKASTAKKQAPAKRKPQKAAKKAPARKAKPAAPKPDPIPRHVVQRVQDVRQAIARPARSLATFPSAEAARLRGQEGLVQLPFLTINDLLALRKAGFRDVEDLERRWTDVPTDAWPSVVRLVEARVLRLPTEVPREFAATG